MFRTVFLILFGNAAASLLLLARNLVVARLIPVEDYGIASTFAISLAVIEMISALGLQQQIVQARDGDDPDFQAALQGFQLLRGLLSGAALFLLAGPLADFMNVPEAAWAYRVMALVPVLNATVHFDIHRLNRRMVFAPMLLSSGLPALITLLAVWPMAAWFGDYRVLLYAIVGQFVLMSLVSHLMAERPWRLRLDRAVIGRALQFGWPLLVNNILLFGVFNGDRVIVGRELGMAELAVFSMGMTLTLTPTLVLAKSAQNYFLPLLARSPRDGADSEERFVRLARVVFQLHLAFGTALATGALLAGPFLVYLLLGVKYAPLTALIVWFAVMQGLRVFKGGPSIIALARGRTENAMIANLVRIAVIPLAWWFAVNGGDVRAILLTGIGGEALGFLTSLLVLRYRLGFRLRPLVLSCLAALACLGAVLVAGLPGEAGSSRLLLVVAALLFAFSFVPMHELRNYAFRRRLGTK